MHKHHIAEKKLADLGPADFSGYRDERLKEVGPGTVLRELGLLSAVMSCATIMDWGYPIENPIQRIRKPAAPEHRDRRLEDDEEERLLDSARSACSRARGSRVSTLRTTSSLKAWEYLGKFIASFKN